MEEQRERQFPGCRRFSLPQTGVSWNTVIGTHRGRANWSTGTRLSRSLSDSCWWRSAEKTWTQGQLGCSFSLACKRCEETHSPDHQETHCPDHQTRSRTCLRSRFVQLTQTWTRKIWRFSQLPAIRPMEPSRELTKKLRVRHESRNCLSRSDSSEQKRIREESTMIPLQVLLAKLQSAVHCWLWEPAETRYVGETKSEHHR